MSINDIDKLKAGMWVKTTNGHVAKVKAIDMRFPLRQNIKFPIIYTDDDKYCWDCEHIEQYGFNINIY